MAEQSECDITIYCKGNLGGTRLGDCPFTQKALICASLHGLKVDKKYIDITNKPQDFLDLNKPKDDSFKMIAGDSWKASTPVMIDRKNKVMIFDSGEICNFLEETYKPAVLSKNNPDSAKIPGAKTAFFAMIGLVKDVGSRNNGVIDDEVDKEKLEKYKTALSGLDGYLGNLYSANEGAMYLNGTKDISLLDIQLLPMLNACAIHSQNALNINITNDKSEYTNLGKYLNDVYKQDWWKENDFLPEDSYDLFRQKFGLNSSDGKYPPKDEEKESNCDITIYCKGNAGATRLGDCPFTQKALICASLHGLNVEKKYIDLSNKPQDFLDLNKPKDDSFKMIAGDSWKASTPVMVDRKNKVMIFDSGEICNYLEENYKPAVLSKNNPDSAKVPGAKTVFGSFIGLVKDVGSKNNGIINGDVDKEKLQKYITALYGLEGYLEELTVSNKGDGKEPMYLNGTKEISLLDIQLIPMLNACAVHSQNALNINITNDKSEYKHLRKYLNDVYQQDWWKENAFLPQDSFDIFRKKFGLNSSDGKYAKEESKEESKEEENTGFYAVPDSPEKLYDYLCAAMALELSTLPLYITAFYSFKPESELSDTAKAAKKLVRDVIMEEMLHMNLVNNIMASVYGVSKATTKFNIPYGKGCKLPANIRQDIDDVSLKPYCKEALYDTFIQIEAPTSMIKEHQPQKQEDGTIRYPFEPKKGENSVVLTFTKRDDLNQIGEFYNAIQKSLTDLSEKKLISFKADDKEHKQRKCKSRTKETDDITELKDALEAIDLICEQGEGYELKEGVFGAVCKDDGDENIENDLGTSEKTHFIKFIECLVGKELISLKIVEDKKETVSYKFTYGDDAAYKVDFDKEIYPKDHFSKPAQDNKFNDAYKDMLEKLTDGLAVDDIGAAVQAMRDLAVIFKEYMDKKLGFPTFEVKEFPLPPNVGQVSK